MNRINRLGEVGGLCGDRAAAAGEECSISGVVLLAVASERTVPGPYWTVFDPRPPSAIPD